MEQKVFPLFLLLFCQTVHTQVTPGNLDNEIPNPYYCYGDYCNMNGYIDYCDDIDRRCNPCTNILDECFTSKQPANCTSACKKHMVEQLDTAAKEKACPKLSEIKHGTYNGSVLDVYKPGDTVQFSCDDKYRVVGNRHLECRNYGIWSADTPRCEEVECQAPLKVTNGKHNGSSDRFLPGAIVVTSCNYGHLLHGQSTTACNSNGLWTNPLPLCEQIKCARPHPIRNGFWSPSHSGQHVQHAPGNTVSAQCKHDFLIDGSVLWNCSNEGLWISNESFWPICLQRGDLSSESSSQQWSSWIGAAIALGVGLVCSVVINCYMLYKRWIPYQNERGILYQRDPEHLKDLDVSEDEQTTLISKTDEVKESEIDGVVSLDKKRQAKEKVVLVGSGDIPEPNTVRSNSKEPCFASNNTGGNQHPPVTFNVTFNNENTNQNTVINKASDEGANHHTKPKTFSNGDDTVTQENPLVSPPKASEFDKAPVEESGTSFHPTQPESSDSTPTSQSTCILPTQPELSDDTPPRQTNSSGYTMPIQPESSDGTPSRQSESPSRDDVSVDIEDQNAAMPMQQTINNEQDRGQKMVLPNSEINTDDMDV